MNKKIMWAVIIVLILILLAWNYSSPVTQESATNSTKKVSTEAVPDNPIEARSPESSSISSIQDAMKSGKPMRCTYAINSVQSVIMVNGNKLLTNIKLDGADGHVLFDGENQYVWNDTPKGQGSKISKACLDEITLKLKNIPTLGGGNQELVNITKDLENASEIKCESVEGTDFSIPSNVTFADQCAIMQKGMEMMKQYQNTPSN